MESFESWLLHRVAQAVEAGEVSAELLTELQAVMEVSRDIVGERPQEECHADAVQDISVELKLPVEKVEGGLAGLEA